jgi:transcriptional regulator, TetR family
VKQGFKGVTMSAVAQRAHVGKGTPYLYWNTKEDLFLEIIARSLADVLHNLAVRVRAEPALAVAERLCVALAKAWLERPLVRALQVTDADVLGALLDDPRAHAIAAESGPSAILRRLIPLWREHGTVRTDWSAEEQAAALELLLIGYFAAQTRTISPGMAEDRAGALGMSISAMLQASQPTKADSVPLASRVSDLLDEHAEQLQNAQAEHRRE